MKRNKTEGFTLIELLVVIAVIAILAAILVPAVTKVIADAKWTEMKSNGKNMYTAVFADAVDADAVGFPSSADGYADTKAYIETLAGQVVPPGGTVAVKVIPAAPDFFSGPGVKAAANWGVFAAQNHAWRVIINQDETADAGTPFFISRNCNAAFPVSTTAVLLDTDCTSASGTPPVKMTGWNQKVCVAFHGAGSEVLKVGKDPIGKLNGAEASIAATDFLTP